jgi:signal transduction histidine kinase
VVDDNADMRQYLVHLLADRFRVRSAQDGEAALAAIREDAPDLVLTDVMMPRLDGFGLIRELRSDPKIKKIPVIVLSARAGEEARVEGMEQGADDYLIKPFSARELLARVNTHLQMARLRNESEEVLSEQVRLRTRELEARTTKVVQQSEQLRDLSHRMLQMQDNERRHVARELHDSAGQILAALGMSLAHVAQIARTSAPQVVEGLRETQQLVDQLSKEIRTMSYLLHPPLLDESGLPVALHWYAEGLAERSGLKISVNIPEDLGRFGRDMELTIFRLVQECLTNIHRHSGSKTADITVWTDDRELGLEIRDQGRGIPPERLAFIQAQGGGVGIRGMRERIHPFQGTMEIESNDAGTRISFRIPVPREMTSAEESPGQPIQVPA